MFPKRSAFHPDEQAKAAKLFEQPSVEEDRQAKEAGNSLDQAIYDLNELSEDLRYAKTLGEDEVRELHRRIEDVRDEVYGSLRTHGSSGLNPRG